jgi:hypothetical protein
MKAPRASDGETKNIVKNYILMIQTVYFNVQSGHKF